MNDLAIHTEGLVKSFGKTRAVDGLDLKVPRGSVYGFLGRNGAGKTTTVKTLLGLLRPSAGSAEVLGYDIRRDLIAILERTGFVPENKTLFSGLTPAQLVHFNQGYFPKWSSELVARYADLFEIPMQTPFSKLSLGNKTKVCHLLALCQGADLLILDEPSIGLDPVITDLLLRVLVEDHVSEGKTVFLSSHQLAEVERIADWVGIIEKGKILLETRLEDIRQNYRLIRAAADAAPTISSPDLIAVQCSENFRSYLVTREAEDFAAMLRAKGMTILEILPVSLEEVFLGLTRKEAPCISGRPGTLAALA
ncbi:MAG: ABC transporter ATP-binding protein [Terriglobia bacterium]|jgi:ABC-2 type transport system ATP-binding protein